MFVERMFIDCATCPVREVHCPECVVTALAAFSSSSSFSAGPAEPSPTDLEDVGRAEHPPGSLALDSAELRAVEHFVSTGLLSRRSAVQLRAEPSSRSGRQRTESAGRAAG